MNRVCRRLAVTALLAGGVWWMPVAAQVEGDIDPRRCSRDELFNCLDGAGSGVTSLDSLRVSGTRRAVAEGDAEERAREQARIGQPGAPRGVAAGAASGAWTLWGGGGAAFYEGSVAIAPYEVDSYTVLLGADRFFGDRLLAGFSVGYEDTSSDTFYNGGGQDRGGVSGAAYAAYLVNDVVSLDASAGYGRLNTDEDRLDPVTGATLLGKYDARRAFFSANVNATTTRGRWVLGARLGALHAVEVQDAYAEVGGPSARTVRKRRVDLTQAYASVDVGWSLGAWEPYALIEYRNDLARDDGNEAGGLPGGGRTQPDDDDEWQGGLGIRYFGPGGVTGSFEWLRTEGREDFDSDTLSLTLRVPF